MTQAKIGGKDTTAHLIHHYGCHFEDIAFSWCGRYGIYATSPDTHRSDVCDECKLRETRNEPAVNDNLALRAQKLAEKAGGKKAA